MAPGLPATFNKHNSEIQGTKDGDQDPSLCRKLRLCAALLANDAGLVFMQLYMLPVLQALGVPVSMETIAGIMSGSLALTALPLLGMISDGGSNPNGRKKPAVVASMLVYVTGLLLVACGCAMHLWGHNSAQQLSLIALTTNNASVEPWDALVNSSSTPAISEVFAGAGAEVQTAKAHPTSAETESTNFQRQQASLKSSQASHTSLESDETSQGSPGWLDDPVGLGVPAKGIVAIAGFVFLDTGYDLSNSCAKTFALAASPAGHHVSLLVLGVLMSATGGCVTALTGLFDIGSVLTAGTTLDPAVAQALLQSSFIVFLALLCTLCTLVSGKPLASTPKSKIHEIITPVHDFEQSQSILASFGTLQSEGQEHVIMAITSPFEAVSSTQTVIPDSSVYLFPSSVPDNVALGDTKMQNPVKDSGYDDPEFEEKGGDPRSAHSCTHHPPCDCSEGGVNTNDLTSGNTVQPHDVAGSSTSKGERGNEEEAEGSDVMVTSFIDADTEPLLEKKPKYKKTQHKESAENVAKLNHFLNSSAGKMVGRRPRAHPAVRNHAEELRKTLLQVTQGSNFGRQMGVHNMGETEADEAESSHRETKRLIKKDSTPTEKTKLLNRLNKNKRNLILICLSTFFMAGSVQSFNMSVTDYLGKVIFSGDPEADPSSQSYVAYQEGLRTGSLGMLMLNVAYILFNLVHRKILGYFGPRVEHFTVSAIQAGLLLTLRLTDDQYVFYVTSVVYGVFRSMMYTIPFMLANEICQEEAMAGAGKSKVGSTMALVTSMLPLAYVVVSSMIGPVIDATGDPGAPMYYSIGCTVTGALVFVWYKQK